MLQTELLGDQHKKRRKSFSCGVPALDSYLLEYVSQDRRRNLTIPYVLSEPETGNIIGYYTLHSAQMLPVNLSPTLLKNLPRCEAFPTIMIGRFAIDKRCQGQKRGGMLLMDALYRCYDVSHQIGAMAVTVDAKDEVARSFYERFNFIPFEDVPNSLYLPMPEIAKLFTPAKESLPQLSSVRCREREEGHTRLISDKVSRRTWQQEK